MKVSRPVSASIELAFAFVVLLVGPIARELGHQGPLLVGWLVAVLSMPLVLAVDALDKRWRRRRSEVIAG